MIAKSFHLIRDELFTPKKTFSSSWRAAATDDYVGLALWLEPWERRRQHLMAIEATGNSRPWTPDLACHPFGDGASGLAGGRLGGFVAEPANGHYAPVGQGVRVRPGCGDEPGGDQRGDACGIS